MVDDTLINKAATIERCVARVREEFKKADDNFHQDYSRQDAAILNIQRACEAALDAAQYIVRRDKLGIPQSSRDLFTLLAQSNKITTDLAEKMKRMVGFRNIAVHDYQSLLLPIVTNIINHHLNDFLDFSAIIVKN
jgi:uncharacterized protein YutE (UPF0331/DUF86 family)